MTTAEQSRPMGKKRGAARHVAAAASALVQTPSQERARIKAQIDRITQSKEASLVFLQTAGILDEAGELTAPYRQR